MFALLIKGSLVGLFETDGAARSLAEQLGLKDFEIKPASFAKEEGKVQVQIKWTLEKFEGDEQSPETLIETLQGDG